MPFEFEIGGSRRLRVGLAAMHAAAALAVLLLPLPWLVLLVPVALSLWRCDRLQGRRCHAAAVVRVRLCDGRLWAQRRDGGVIDAPLLTEAAICLPLFVVLSWRGRWPGWPGTLLVARDAVTADSHRRLRRLIRDGSLRA